MKILVVADNKDIKELLTFQITSRFETAPKECASAREAVDLLTADPAAYQLLISPYNGPQSVVVKYLRECKNPLPVIFFYDPAITRPDTAALAGLEVVGTVESAKLVDGTLAAIESFVQKKDAGATFSEFCPIRTNLLIRVSPLKSEIYIRLSEKKFVKLFRVGDEFNTEDLEKYYETKKVEYMYLRRSDTSEFITKFRRELEELILRTDVKKEEEIATAEAAQETVHELINKVGFTEEVQELAKKNIELTLKSVGSNPPPLRSHR